MRARPRPRPQLEYTTIEAPFDGIVTLRTVDLGDIVYQASSPKGKAEPLLRVARVDVIRVKTYVPELDSIWADVGDAATVTFEALPGRVFTSKVARVSGALDPATRTMLVEIDLPNADGLIRPGLYGRARIALERREHALVLPSGAVRVGDGGAQVFVVAGDALHRKDVALGLVDSQWTEITSGLDEGERVVADAAACESRRRDAGSRASAVMPRRAANIERSATRRAWLALARRASSRCRCSG